jgi:hypothetical protein
MPTRRTPQALEPPRLHGLYNPPGGVIHEAPPWGFVIPAEAWEQGVPYHVTVEAGPLPVGATVTLHWEHKDGTYKEQASAEYDGSTDPVVFVLQPAWLAASIGKPVSLYYEVTLHSGDRVQGPAIDIDMAAPLEVAPIRLEELAFGEPLDPEKFPDAIHPIVERIPNLRPYHQCAFYAMVAGVTADGFMPLFRLLELPLEGIAEGAVRLTVPASLYTNTYDDNIVHVYIRWVVSAPMLPPPNIDWINSWLVGVTDVLPTALVSTSTINPAQLPRSIGFRASLPDAPRGTRRSLLPARLHARSYPPEGAIEDVPPWGCVIPAEAVEQHVPYYASVDAGPIPIGATVVLHWEHKDGGYHREVSVIYDGAGSFVPFLIQPEWLHASIGKPVSLHYVVVNGTGDRLPGPSVDIDMAPPLEVSPLLIEGVDFGAPLDPAAFPVELLVTVERIRNARPYHRCLLRAAVMGESEEGEDALLRLFSDSLETVADAPVRIRVPAALYTGLDGTHYRRVYIRWLVEAHMLPFPAVDWHHTWLVAQTDILPSPTRAARRG